MLKKALKAIFKVSLRQLFVLASYALLFIVIFVFMMIGFGIFPRHYPALLLQKHNTVNEEGNEYFNSSAEAYWNLIVYLSTANNPDIATPAYKHHRLFYLYFCAFYFIGKVLILNVIAAFYAINFNSFIDESMERTWKHQKSSLHWAFDNMKPNKQKWISTDKVKKIVRDLNINDECWDGLNFKSIVSYKDFENLIIGFFYKKPPGQGSTEQTKYKVVGINKFRKGLSFLTNVLGFLVAVFQFFALTVLVIKDYNDTLTGPNSIMVKTMMGFSIVLGIEIITRIILLIMKCAIRHGDTFCCKQNSNNQNEKNLCKKFFNWFFCGHSLRLSGRKKFIKFPLLIFDWLLLVAVFSLGLVHFPCLVKEKCLNLTNVLTLTQITICCIAIRMLRMLAKIPIFSFVFNNLIRILYLFIPFLLLGYLFYYEFAIVGMAIFRGVNLNDTEAAAECGSYQNLEYYPYNFKDFGSTLVLLWNLMIVNNWHVMVDAYVKQTSIYSRIYFVIWWLVCETIINGVIIGLLIEILTNAKGGLENVIKKSINKIREQKFWKDKLSLILGFYVFSGEKSRVLLEAHSYSFGDIIKIVFCKIMPKCNKPAKPLKLKRRSKTMPCQQELDLPSSSPRYSLQVVDMTPKSDQEFQRKDDTEQGNTEQVEIDTYELLYHYESDDEYEGSQSTQESEDEELPDNFQDLSWNIFDTLEYIKNQRTTENKAKKCKQIK
ncbi:PREDICTED: two pore calcium channel protein 2-like [Amphimedon queenslandica]|nr:PREDICTED: two pore calcium channel protein 2-like [Amphimedon queenslandica]|eukprot:XP_011410207.2 PREDICTED: two pore calcium channel protein 2-like [Amphimedon queenslandica]